MASFALPALLPRIQNPDLEFAKYLNFLLVLKERRALADIARGLPFDITIDLSTICQLSCPYCSVGSKTIDRKKGLMKREVHSRVLAELADTLFLIAYFNTGEPLLNKRLPELIKQGEGKEVFSEVSTNLSLPLSDNRIDEILLSGLSFLIVSLDGACADTYVRYRVGGDFDLVVSNMLRLIKRKRELGLQFPIIEWRFLVFEHNAHELDTALKMAEEFEVDLIEIFQGGVDSSDHPSGVRAADEASISQYLGVSGPALRQGLQRRETALQRFLGDTEYSLPGVPTQHLMRKKCDWLYFGTAVFPNGSVSPCCVSNNEPNDFGTMAEGRNFRSVWNNHNYQAARKMFVDGSSPEVICSQCPIPLSQDLQFRQTLRGILRVAPDWVLHVLRSNPDQFFYRLDFLLMAQELDAITDESLQLDTSFPALESVRQILLD